METVALLYEDYQKELAEDFKNTFLKRASDTDSSRSNDTVIDEVTDMLSTNIAVYTEKLLQRWGFSSGGEGGGGGDVTVTLDDLLKKYLSDNYVTIKGDQEVFGEKDFRKGIRIAGRRLYWDEGNDALVIEGAAYTTRWLSAKGVSPGGGGSGSGGAAAMYQLIDVSPNDTKDAVLGAEKDYVLTFDGSFWRGMPNKGGLSSKLFTALDKEGNEVNPDDENAEIYAIRANYSLWSVGFLSAKGISDGGTGGGGGGAVALYQLLDVEKNADITGVAGATKGSVLTFNGDKWYADKPKTAAGISNLFTALDKDGNDVDLNDESKLSTITNIRANYALWSVDWISAKGKSSGGSGGGGGLINLVYGFESLGGTFDNNDNSATFNAFTINEIWKLASSGLTNVTVTGSGNAVTDVTKGSDGRSLTFTKGSTFATKSEFDALNTKFNDFLTGSDADDIINKWSELEVFLQGMKESDNLAVILQSKMDKTAFSKLFTALDASGNEVDPSDDTKTIASIRANFGFWGVDYISAKGVSKGSGGTGGASALYQLVDVLANDTEDGVEGAAAGKALVFDGTHWRAGDAGLNESQLYSYLTANKYLTQSAADSRYVTSSRKVIAGTGLSGGGALTSDVTLSLGTSGVVAGTYTKVMVDAYGRVTSGTNLSATDIPNLDWSKITTGKPTTLAGYGITDAYTKTEADGKYVTIATAQTVSGAKTFSATMKTSSVLPSTDANSALGGTANRWSNVYSVNGVFSQNVTAKLLSASESLQIGDAYLKWDAANNAVYVIKKDGTTPVGFYSTDWLSAKGVSISGVQTGTLADLNDVEITDPTNGQALKYDAASKKWVNGTIDSFNVNQMWAELKKADSSKIIDASHIPTSVLDGRWVKKTGDTMTGTLTSASSSGSIVFKGLENCDITNIYKDNRVIRDDDGGFTSIRNGLRFNWYDTYWYIGNLRGSSTDSAGFGVVDHNNKLVLRVTPNDVRAPRFMSTVATGVSPLIVSSNTLVNNLNADLLDGYHQSAFLRADGVNQHVTLTGENGNTEGYRLVLDSTLTGGWSINGMTLLVNSRHSGTGIVSIVFQTTNQESTTFVGSLNYYGSLIGFGNNMWRLFYNTSTKKLRLFWHFYDYNDCQVSILNRRGIMLDIANSGWYTTIPDGMGTEIPSYYNRSDTTGSLATSRTLWGQPFNGTANVSGNMTGVGSINMSGQLTSTVASGTAPFIVASNTVVGNLNADLLDGVHLAGLSGREGVMRSWLRGRYTTVNQYFGNGNVVTIDPKPTDDATLSVNTTVLSLGDTPTRNTQLAFHYDTNTIKYRRHDDSKWNDWVVLLHSGNYASYSDGRYVKKAGDTMTGDLAMDTNKGFYIPHGTRVVKTSGNWIHGGGDMVSYDDANLRFGSWYGIGWYPTISGQTVAQGKNAMWLNVRNGNLDTHGVITSHNGYLAANWDSARRLVIGGGSTYAWIDSRNSSNSVLCNILLQDTKVVIGNYAESSRFVSTVGTGTQPYRCNSTTLNTNLNADLLDGNHGAYYQNRMYDGFVSQHQAYDYIEFLRFVIPSGQNQLKAYVIFDLCRVETGGDMNGRAVLRIRRGTDNNAGYIFYVTNFGRSWLPELRCTTDDGITWRVWMKCVKDAYDPYIAIKIVEQYPYGYVTTQGTGTTGTPGGSKYTVVAGMAGLSNAANVLVNTRNIFGQPFNGSGDVGGQMTSTSIFVQTGDATLKVYSGRITDTRSDGNICLQTSIDATDGQSHSYPTQYQSRCNLSLQPRGGQVYIGQNPDGGDTGYKLTVNGSIKSNGNIIATGAITAKASSSDIRLKTDIQGYDAMGIIRKFRSVKYHWNAIAKENSEVFNHDNWNYGLIAQDLLSGGYSQWVKDIFNDYYTIDYERLIPVVWKGLQEVDDEVTKLKREVARLNKRVKELEKSLCA